MKALISVRNLNKTFSGNGIELHVLKGINLEIYEGEVAAIMGPSGVGKSTLLHIIGTLDMPTSGDVFYEDRDISSLDENALSGFRNRTIGFIFQFHHLLPEFTAVENIMMPAMISQGSRGQGVKGSSYGEIKEKAERLLKELDVYERRNHKPGELSGGEQQRIAAARALILEPKIVFADEPTGNLDTQTGDELFNLLIDLNRKKGITFLIVTHNDALASKCGRIIRILDGRVV
ncbi:MAG: ABC transporter ATP-binding protein [Nitrospirae bacterium]|nr:ABC transporter ATP-binding protein [Nitrospirota bacterium]